MVNIKKQTHFPSFPPKEKPFLAPGSSSFLPFLFLFIKAAPSGEESLKIKEVGENPSITFDKK